ncbi:unnamed protein product [Cochlearia groenlandica]
MVRSEIARRRFLTRAEMAPATTNLGKKCSISPKLETIFEERSVDFKRQDCYSKSKVVVGQRQHRIFLLVPAIISAVSCVSCVLMYRHDRVVQFS